MPIERILKGFPRMFARRRSFAAVMAPIFTAFVAGFVAALLVLAPAAASETTGWVAAHDHIVFAKTKSCAKIQAPQPSQRECRHVAGFAAAIRRLRSEVQDIAVSTSVLQSIRVFSGYGVQRLQIRSERLRPPWTGVRAPFWAVFAMAPQLRN